MATEQNTTFDWVGVYDSLHGSAPGRPHQPVVGITGNFGEKGCELAEGYYQSLLQAGATPVVIPPFTQPEALLTILDRVDALLLSGGGDLNPLYLGEEPVPGLGGINAKRDLAELLLVRLAFDRQVPMLGICRGIQVLTAALGGSLYQDLASQYGQPLIKHSQDLDRTQASHTVTVEPDTLLAQLFPQKQLPVNSFHHQAVREPGPHLRVCAHATDGVIEAVESNAHKSILGVQWHPECFCLAGNDTMLPLFQWLCNEASNYRAARRFHEQHLSLDSHCDTPMFFQQDIHFDQRDPHILVDLHKMTEGHLDASIMVAYLPQQERTPAGHEAAFAQADSLLTQIEDMVTGANQRAVAQGMAEPLILAHTPADLAWAKANGRKAIMPAIENGYAIGTSLDHLRHFAQRGIVYLTLCHNGNNEICGSARPREGEPQTGLTHFGADVVQEMNRLGIMVDLSHASERSFFDALDASATPIVCSHSSARALCDHPRNLTDDQLRALAGRGGVAQVTFYDGFLRQGGGASILDAVAHLNHMVQIMGVEHVGIGTDFDGDGGVPGLASASELINLTRRLLRQRYSEADLALIWGGNFLRVMQQVQASRQ